MHSATVLKKSLPLLPNVHLLDLVEIWRMLVSIAFLIFSCTDGHMP